jgi:hypothetical protein
MTVVAIGYPDSPLNGPDLHGEAGPEPGERVAPASGQAPVGSGAEPLFALFAEQNEATANLLQRFEGLLDPDVRLPFSQNSVWLVRPDGYVSCSATDAGVIADYLGGLIGSSGS